MAKTRARDNEKCLDEISLEILPQVLKRSQRQLRRMKSVMALSQTENPPAIDCAALLQIINNAQALYTEFCPGARVSNSCSLKVQNK